MWSVILVKDFNGNTELVDVVLEMEELTEAKVKAIAMILNAEELR